MVFVFHHDHRPDLALPHLQCPHKKTARSPQGNVQKLKAYIYFIYSDASRILYAIGIWLQMIISCLCFNVCNHLNLIYPILGNSI